MPAPGEHGPGPADRAAASEQAAGETEAQRLSRLRAEVSALEAGLGTEAPATDPAATHSGWWRSLVVVVCLALIAVLAPLSIVATWAHDEVSDTNRYVETVAPLARDPALQSAIATRVTQEITSRIDLTSITNEAAAALRQRNAPPRVVLGVQALAGALSQAVDSFIASTVQKVVSSDAFAAAWDQVNRVAHTQLVTLLTGQSQNGVIQAQGNTVSIDLATLIATVKQQLEAQGFALASRIPTVHAQFVIFEAGNLPKAQRAFRALSTLALALPIVCVVLLGIALLVTRRRRRTLLAAALVVAGSMLVLGLGLNAARAIYLDAIPASHLSSDAAAALFDTMVRFIRFNLRALLALTLAIAFVAWVTGPGSSARSVRRVSARTLESIRSGSDSAGLNTGRVGLFLGRNRTAIRIGIAALVILIYVLQSHPTGKSTIVLLVVAALVLLVVEVLARRPAAPAVAAAAGSGSATATTMTATPPAPRSAPDAESPERVRQDEDHHQQ